MDRVRAKQLHIAVIGDVMIDHYIWGDCNRISPEAPVQVVLVDKQSSTLGGAGNVVNNLHSLGASVSIFSVVGNDANAIEVRELLDMSSVQNITMIEQTDRVTTKKSRIIASNQQVIRYDIETTKEISEDASNELFKEFEKNIELYDVVLLSDYAKGLLTVELAQKIIILAKQHDKPVLVDPKGDDYGKYKGATLLTPNKKEAMQVTNTVIDSLESLKEAGEKLKNELELSAMIITISEDGIALFDDKMHIIPTVAREVYDVTGAGDTVLASLAVALASGLSMIEICEFANKAAAVVVAKVGSATVTLNEIEEYEHSLNKGNSDSKIKTFLQTKRVSKRLKEQKRKIVFTNGCFDILHKGHASYLEKAKSLGDILIVGLNSDESIRELKGDSRPINTLEDRAFLLAALESVDFVVPFTSQTPYELIKLISPDILVKGEDYKDKIVVGSDIVDEVVLIEMIEGRSTSGVISKINNMCIK